MRSHKPDEFTVQLIERWWVTESARRGMDRKLDAGERPPHKPYSYSPPVSTVYFISDGAAIKIGTTRAGGVNRCMDLQTAHSRKLVLLAEIKGDYSVERDIHYRWRSIRIRGEWFKPTPELVAFIDGLKSKIA